MLTDLFLLPGRLVARLFVRDRKKAYRSLRQRSEAGWGLFLLSLGLWLAAAGGLLHGLDRAGLLKQALDAGVEAALVTDQPAEVQPPPPPPGTPSAGGNLSAADATAPPPVIPAETGAFDGGGAARESEMWLVILHTIPKAGRAEAERRQGSYKTRGLEVEIMDTNAFPKLQPNLWIIALGPFDDRAAALAAADRAKAFNSGLMVRRGL